MKIEFTRHARQRAKLYSLDLNRISKRVEKHLVENGRQLASRIAFVDEGFRSDDLPLKIVYVVEEHSTIVITMYPLKKRSP